MIWKQVNHPDILPGYLISPKDMLNSKVSKMMIVLKNLHIIQPMDMISCC